jgi:HD-like signal output (HDOD) protein
VETSIKSVVEQGVSKLPALPTAALRIIEVVNDISCSPKDLMDVIKVDPVLTGRILNLVNSSYFSMPQRITSLNRALILLGFNTIKNIALSTAFIDASRQLHSDKINDLWQHLLGVGVASKLIATKCGQPRQILEEFFIAGLLHDIGDLMLLRFAPEQIIKLINANSTDQNFESQCLDLFEITGPDCGHLMVQHWKLPPIFTEVVRHREKAGKNSSFVVNTVHLADKIIRQKKIGLTTDFVDLIACDEELTLLGLKKQDLVEICEQLQQNVEKAQVFVTEKK